jgi:hypothetical protein
LIKASLWDSKNEPLLAGLDRYYAQHHPAVRHVQEMFKRDHGEDLGEQALFPAFWLHWLTIQAHDKDRFWGSRAQNADTDHAVYFNSVKRVLDKYGIPHDGKIKKMEGIHDATLSARTAHAYKELEGKFGHVGASLAFFAHMVPALVGNTQLIAKALAVRDALRKAQGDHTVEFRGNKVKPGKLQIVDGASR